MLAHTQKRVVVAMVIVARARARVYKRLILDVQNARRCIYIIDKVVRRARLLARERAHSLVNARLMA